MCSATFSYDVNGRRGGRSRDEIAGPMTSQPTHTTTRIDLKRFGSGQWPLLFVGIGGEGVSMLPRQPGWR
jgi:hypothetical protein